MKSISLVLGSGGARGYAHIGVIRALLDKGYSIKSVSGCSMGAVVGGFYAAGQLDEFETWARSLTYLDVLKMLDISFLSNGAIRGDKLFNRLSQMLNGIKIEDLNIPFTAVATDIAHQKEIWFSTGRLEEAIRASSAIPSVLMPVIKDGRILVDGAVLNPLPITPVVGDHAESIIAVELSAEVPMPGGRDEAADAAREAANEKEKQNWFSQLKLKTMQFFERSDEHHQAEETLNANLGKLGVIYQMFDTMQSSLTQYKMLAIALIF